jgi:hypothetical protein
LVQGKVWCKIFSGPYKNEKMLNMEFCMMHHTEFILFPLMRWRRYC